MISTVYFYRQSGNHSVMASSHKLERNPFPFPIEHVGTMKTTLSIGQVRGLLRSGQTHVQIYSEHRYTAPEPVIDNTEHTIYIYRSAAAQGGFKATLEHRVNTQPVEVVKVIGQDKMQQTLRGLRDRIRKGELFID